MTSKWIFCAALLYVAPAAAADDWASIDAFPAHPCPDGWTSCVVDGTPVSPDMTEDSAGRPMPSDLRVGWFDLEPMPVFSSFADLSDYQAKKKKKKKKKNRDRAEEQPVASSGGGSSSGGSSSGAGGSGGGDYSGGGAAEPAPNTAADTPVADAGTATAGGGGGEETQAHISTAPVGGPATCDDLLALEPFAALGQLSPGQRECLEGRISQSQKQTSKDKLSRLLIVDSEARKDTASWERLIRRHLEDIDRSDPDLCFKYALYLSRRGAARAQGVIRWADYALENKSRWKGSTFKSRVYNLYRLRTEAANRLWQAAAEKLASARSEENQAKVERYRNQTKQFAREWLDYARASKQNTNSAMEICISAAGKKNFCEGG